MEKKIFVADTDGNALPTQQNPEKSTMPIFASTKYYANGPIKDIFELLDIPDGKSIDSSPLHDFTPRGFA